MNKIHHVTLYPGEGIGPEVTDAAVRVIAATGVQIDWDRQIVGEAALEQFGNPLPDEALASFERTRVALKGPLNTPPGGKIRSLNVELRKRFDLYTNLRPVTSFAGVKSRYEGVDLVIFRENTEGFYIGDEDIDPAGEWGVTRGRITKTGSERIVRAAFEYARAHRKNSPYAQAHGRPKVTLLHKANIIKAHGIFANAGKRIAKEFPDVEYDDAKMADARQMELVLDPSWFDVLVTTNFVGDMISDLAAGLIGGLGLAPGANIGNNAALFEAVHGTWPQAAGQNRANPTAVILSGAMMLRHVGENAAADQIERAVRAVLREGRHVTPDVKVTWHKRATRYFRERILRDKPVGTREMTDAIIKKIKSQ